VFELSIAGGFALSHGAPLFALPLLLVMVPGICAVFPRRGVLVAVSFAALLLVGVAFALDARQVIGDPAVLALPLALLGTLTLVGRMIGRSAVGYRGAAVVDQLTGMLNRSALHARVAEIEARSAVSGEPIAVIIGDVDHFKEINDQHGHAAGDAVLVEVAYRMRKCLRAFESAYRIGGEEFAILLPGVAQPAAVAVAERMRLGVRNATINGLAVTMSFGVVATASDEKFKYEAVFASADAALYGAKQTGRDRVCVNGGDESAPPAIAAA
jgi:diguanylate cyclase (GGDEF)-like protein